MGYWIKYFSDHAQEYGRDKEIDSGDASWSKGRLSEINKVLLEEDGSTGALLFNGDSKWNQFDRFEVIMGIGKRKSVRVYRAIQVEITEAMTDKTIYINKTSRRIICSIGRIPSYSISKLIPKSMIGQWLTVAISGKKVPFVVFSKKNSLRGLVLV